MSVRQKLMQNVEFRNFAVRWHFFLAAANLFQFVQALSVQRGYFISD